MITIEIKMGINRSFTGQILQKAYRNEAKFTYFWIEENVFLFGKMSLNYFL